MDHPVTRYADGLFISPRRRQKAQALEEVLDGLLPQRAAEIVDFGCADGAIPVLLLQSRIGERIARITGITLLDYNALPEKPCHAHPRFRRMVADLDAPLDGADLPWGQCHAVTATAFFHYLEHPEMAFSHAHRLLCPGGHLIVTLPAQWVLAMRRRGLLVPRNERIRQTHSLDGWRHVAAACGFAELRRQPIQWLGIGVSGAIEGCLRRRPWLCPWGSNYMVIYRR